LCAKADSHAENACRSQERPIVEVQQVEKLQERQEAQDAIGRPADDGCHGAELVGAGGGGVVAAGDAIHASYEKAYDSLQNQQHHKNGRNFGQPIADHNDNVVVPIALNLAKDGLFELFGRVGPEVHCKFREEIQRATRFLIEFIFKDGRCKRQPGSRELDAYTAYVEAAPRRMLCRFWRDGRESWQLAW